MIKVSKRQLKGGTIIIKIGRSSTYLTTSKEADAFIAGVKLAHLTLAAQIAPLLEVKDGQ